MVDFFAWKNQSGVELGGEVLKYHDNATTFRVSDLVKEMLKDYKLENISFVWFVLIVLLDCVLFMCICIVMYFEFLKNRRNTQRIVQLLEAQPSAPPSYVL